MYDMLIMLRPGEPFTLDDMALVVKEVCASGDGEFEQGDNLCAIRAGEANLQLVYNAEDFVLEESQGIAEEYGLDCGECAVRFEMSGDDMDMVLFNDYLLINEKLYATGRFIIFDSYECVEFTGEA